MDKKRRKLLKVISGFPFAFGGMSQLSGCSDTDGRESMLSKWSRLVFENIFNQSKPPYLSIDEIGWDAFLNHWSQESTDLVRTRVFKHGIGSVDVGYIKSIENELGVSVPHEIYFGGVVYPPDTAAQEQLVNDILKQVSLIVERSIEYSQSNNLPKNNPVLYRNLPHIRFTAFEYAALLNRQMHPPATEQEIIAAENRLSVELPESYKNFLKVSNGYWIGSLICLVPVQYIDLVSKLQPDALFYSGPNEPVVNYDEYYRYDNLGRTNIGNSEIMGIGKSLFSKALLLSEPEYTDGQDVDIGIMPYAPGYSKKLNAKGEWEAFISFEFRTRSFKEMMEYWYQASIASERKKL